MIGFGSGNEADQELSSAHDLTKDPDRTTMGIRAFAEPDRQHCVYRSMRAPHKFRFYVYAVVLIKFHKQIK